MSGLPRGITLDEWDARYAELRRRGMREPWYGGPLRRHAEEGDTRLERLRFDDSPAALRLWNFLLTEGDRLREAREAGKKIVGAMKDLGTVPVMAFSFPNLVAFYPDGAWWTPCLKERRGDDLEIADSLGIDESFCPVRAMLGAFVTGARFPIPDLLTCSVGATCDDFSAIAQRLESLGWPIMWWEIPTRQVGSLETALDLPGGFRARREQIQYVQSELGQVRAALEELAGRRLTDKALAAGIHASNGIRGKLADLRECVFSSDPCPFPALEMSIAEMLAIH
ncbi:MAG: 2-hydroxyacyl-CoA dehydratase family protein, partial [Candidatus Sumerlaeota bacterium]|nr:2-hydroxyacyl-CoA dehydratase family protein [Candidatus Sumerlaeota bacterium]